MIEFLLAIFFLNPANGSYQMMQGWEPIPMDDLDTCLEARDEAYQEFMSRQGFPRFTLECYAVIDVPHGEPM